MPIENMTEIESSLGLAEGTLQEAIASDDATKIEIPQGKFIDTETHVIRTKEDQDVFLKNTRDEAKVAGIEQAIKEARNNLGYSFEGKTLENLLKAHGDKIQADTGAEPDAKIQELTTDLEKLRGVNSEWENKYNGLVSESAAKDNQRRIDTNILNSIEGDFILPKTQLSTLFKSEYQVVEEDGKQLIKKNGETQKNPANLEPLALADIMPKFLESFVKPVEGGSGGGDSTGNPKAGTLEAFEKEMSDAGKSREDMNIEMQRRIRDKTLSI
jgi:hypothetical protein